MSQAPVILGIDLGTTNSLVAIADQRGSRIIKDGESALIPSVIYFDEAGRIRAVGQRAKTLKAVDPKRIAYSVKRLMGRGQNDLTQISKELPFDFSQSTNEMIRLRFGNKTYTPIELSAEILKRCKFVAENQLGYPVRKAVITVPAYFNDAQRSATLLAGRLAGLEVIRVLNEPTAAALAFGFGTKGQSKKIAVYDFGGGTFDISVLKVTDGIFEVLSTDGDTLLGGDDLDEAIYQWLIGKIAKMPSSNDEAAAVRALVEQIKIALSVESELDITLHFDGAIQWTGKITREEINEVMKPIVNKTLKLTNSALKASQVSKSDIDEIVMVGGSSRVPLVQDLVKEFFGKVPNTSVNPEEVVALGAAIQGSILSGDISDTLLLDVVPLSLGLETLGGVVTKIIPRNSTIPFSASEFFTTSVDNQTGVDLHILQGEREIVKDCRSLGKFRLKILPAAAGVPKIKVTYLMDSNGILKVEAIDQKTNLRSELEVKPSFGLTDQEVEKMLQDAWTYAEEDFKERQKIEVRNQAEALIRAIEKSLAHPLLDAATRTLQSQKIDPHVKALKADLLGASADTISVRIKEIDMLTQELARIILNKSIQARLENQKLDATLSVTN